MKKKFVLLICFALSLALTKCKKEEIPTITTMDITEITVSEAKSGGTILTDGNEAIILKGVCWSTTQNPTIEDNKTVDGATSKEFTSTLSDLIPGTVYYIRAYATNKYGVGYGQEISFRTLGDPPTALLNPASEITHQTATLTGSINPHYLNCVVVFEYGTTTSYGKTVSANPEIIAGSDAVDVTASLADLLPNTTYHYRIKAGNLKGDSYSPDLSFTTLNLSVIHSISNDSIKYGAVLSLYGLNFNDVSQVKLGSQEQSIDVTPRSKSNEQIEVEIFNHQNPASLLGFSNFRIGLVSPDGTIWSDIIYFKNSWSQMADLPGDPRYKAGSFSLGGNVYVGCGAYNGTVFKDFWKYNPGTNRWTRMTDFPGVGRIYPMGTANNSSGYMGTGHTSDNATKTQLYDFYKYDPVANSWSAIQDYPDPVNNFFLNYATAINNRPFVSISDAVMNIQEIVDDEWVSHPNTSDLMNSPSNAVFTLGNSIYVVCGYRFGSSTVNRSVWEYNTVTLQWTKKNDFPGPARNLSFFFTIENYGYMGCGTTTSGIQFNDMWRYDPTNDSWIRFENFPGGVRSHGVSETVMNKGYAGMGLVMGGPFYFRDLWKFDPLME